MTLRSFLESSIAFIGLMKLNLYEFIKAPSKGISEFPKKKRTQTQTNSFSSEFLGKIASSQRTSF